MPSTKPQEQPNETDPTTTTTTESVPNRYGQPQSSAGYAAAQSVPTTLGLLTTSYLQTAAAHCWQRTAPATAAEATECPQNAHNRRCCDQTPKQHQTPPRRTQRSTTPAAPPCHANHIAGAPGARVTDEWHGMTTIT